MKQRTQGGNCIIGAIWLMITLRTWKVRFSWYFLERLGEWVPHFYVVDRDGKAWHFRYVEDCFEDWLGYFWFRGKFARMDLEHDERRRMVREESDRAARRNRADRVL